MAPVQRPLRLAEEPAPAVNGQPRDVAAFERTCFLGILFCACRVVSNCLEVSDSFGKMQAESSKLWSTAVHIDDIQHAGA